MLTIAALAMVVASCNTNYEKTKSGLTYKIFSGKGNGKTDSQPWYFRRCDQCI